MGASETCLKHTSTASCGPAHLDRRSGVSRLRHPANIAAASTASATWSSIAAAVHAGLIAVWRGRHGRRAIERAVAGCSVRGVTSSSPCVEREEGREVKGEEHKKAVAERGLTRRCEQALGDAKQGSLTFLTPYWRSRVDVARETNSRILICTVERDRGKQRHEKKLPATKRARGCLTVTEDDHPPHI